MYTHNAPLFVLVTEMYYISHNRRVCTYMAYTWMALPGTAVAVSWLSPNPRSSSPCCLWYMCMQWTPPHPKTRVCISAQCTRNHSGQTWLTSPLCGSRPFRVLTTGFSGGSLFFATSSESGVVLLVHLEFFSFFWLYNRSLAILTFTVPSLTLLIILCMHYNEHVRIFVVLIATHILYAITTLLFYFMLLISSVCFSLMANVG